MHLITITNFAGCWILLEKERERRKKLAHERQERELYLLRPTHQMDPVDLTDPEMEQDDEEVRFAPR